MQTGIARKMDNLGRFVIPTEIRRSHGIKAGDSLVISVEGRKICRRLDSAKSAGAAGRKCEAILDEKSVCHRL